MQSGISINTPLFGSLDLLSECQNLEIQELPWMTYPLINSKRGIKMKSILLLSLVLVSVECFAKIENIDSESLKVKISKKGCHQRGQGRLEIKIESIQVFNSVCVNASSLRYPVVKINRKILQAQLSDKKLSIDLESMDKIRVDELKKLGENVKVMNKDNHGAALNLCMARIQGLEMELANWLTGINQRGGGDILLQNDYPGLSQSGPASER